MALAAGASGADRILAAWTGLMTVLLLVPADLLRAWPGLERCFRLLHDHMFPQDFHQVF